MKLYRYIFLAFIFQVFLISFCQAQFIGFFLKDNKRKVSFDFEIYNNLIVVPVMLEGRLPLKFILDTGVSSAIIFDKAYTDILGLQYSRKISVMGVGREKGVDAYVATDVEIDLPGIEGYRQSLLVLDEDYLELKHQLGTEVHGIIGYELFRKFVVEIDYDNKVITFYDDRYYKPKRRWVEFPLDVVSTKPYVRLPIWINNKEKVDCNFMIDTGASHSILVHEKSNDKLYIPDKRLKASLGKGLSGDIQGYLARINKVRMGKFEFNDVIASFPDEESYTDSLINVQKNGTLGGEILSRFNVAFDYLGGAVYLRKGAHYKDDFEYNMSGIDVSAFGPKLRQLRVSQVRKNSPADSVGIKVDDVIIAANGLSGEALTISNIYKIFNTKPGKKIRLTIERDEEKLKKKLILRQAI